MYGVTTSELSSSQQTIESSIYDIEPRSWFYTITPIQHIHYTTTTIWKKTTRADGIHCSDDDSNNNVDDNDDDSID